VQPVRKLSLAEVEEPLRVVVVYEDTAAHLRARHIRDYLVAHLGNEIQLQFSWWPFDLLQEAKDAQQSGGAAAAADLVIFSAQPGNEWPSTVNSWVASWARQRTGRPGAIAAIFSPSLPGSRSICGRQTCLHAVAKSAGMDFLPHEDGRLSSPNFAQADEFIKRVAPTAPIQDVVDRPDSSPYWGING